MSQSNLGIRKNASQNSMRSKKSVVSIQEHDVDTGSMSKIKKLKTGKGDGDFRASGPNAFAAKLDGISAKKSSTGSRQ